jgi:hypothetical protein
MADNVGYTPGAGATVAADEIGGILFQRVKPSVGVDGTAVDVSDSNPMPAQVTGELLEAVEALRMAVQSLNRNLSQLTLDNAYRVRAVLDSSTAGLSVSGVSTVTSVSNVTTLNSLSNLGTTFQASDLPPLISHIAADGLRANISVT